MRKVSVSIFLAVSAIASFAGCGGSDDAADQASVVTAEVTAEPTEEPEPEPQPTSVEEPEPQFVPVGIEVFPGSYAHEMGDVQLLFDLPERGEDVTLLAVVKTEWQIAFTILYDERGPVDTPSFGVALAEPGATIESVVDAMRASDEGRHSFETATSVFAGAEATTVTRVSNRREDELPANGDIADVLDLSTGTESFLQYLYTPDWTMESNIFERDGRVLIVNFDWSPSRGERELVLAEAAPFIESIQLRSSS